jgi:hypothetical protein
MEVATIERPLRESIGAIRDRVEHLPSQSWETATESLDGLLERLDRRQKPDRRPWFAAGILIALAVTLALAYFASPLRRSWLFVAAAQRPRPTVTPTGRRVVAGARQTPAHNQAPTSPPDEVAPSQDGHDGVGTSTDSTLKTGQAPAHL